jgi:nucleoside-diphosphate-sugar epimerase
MGDLMKWLMITGTTDFIGQHVIRQLKSSNYEVHAVARSRPLVEDDNVTFHTIDLIDHVAVKKMMGAVKPTHMLHLVWELTPGKFWSSRDNLDWLSASISLFKHFAEFGGQRFVAAGTCAEYSWSHSVFSEADTPYQPSTLYGSTKNSLQTSLLAAAPIFNVSVSWGHVYFVYGHGEAPGRIISDVVNNCLTRQYVNTTHGHQIRDFMHVVDAAGALIKLMKSNFEGNVNIGPGIGTPVNEVLSIIAEETSCPDLIKYGLRALSPDEPLCMVADVNRLRNEVEFTPQFDLNMGLRDTVQAAIKKVSGSS